MLILNNETIIHAGERAIRVQGTTVRSVYFSSKLLKTA